MPTKRDVAGPGPMARDFAAFRARLLAGAAHYERKDYESERLDEIKELVEKAGENAETWTKSFSARIDEIEKRLNRPGALGGSAPTARPGELGPEEKLRRFNASLVDHAALMKRSAPSAFTLADFETYRAGFTKFIRHGRDALEPAELKAMSVGGDPDGGYLVTPDVSRAIYSVMREVNPMRQVARVQPMSGDAWEEIQDRGGTSGGGWVAETGTRSVTSTPQVSKLRVPVHEQYEQPAATQQLLDDSIVDVEGWLGTKIGEEFAIREGAAFVTGNGVGKPRGFTTYPTEANNDDGSRGWGTWAHVVTGTDASFGTGAAGAEKLIDVVHSLKPRYRRRAAWIMNTTTLGLVRKLKDDAGQFVFSASLQAGQPDTLIGYPVVEMEDMPDAGTGSLGIAFGDFQRGYLIADRMAMRVLRDPYTNKPYVNFYSTARVGGDAQDFRAVRFLKFSS